MTSARGLLARDACPTWRGWEIQPSLRDASRCGRVRPTASPEPGRIRLEFTGARRGTYIVEASADLSHWAGIGVARETADGTFEFEDATAQAQACRFYRVVRP